MLGNVWVDWPEDTPIEQQDGLVFSEESVIRPVMAKIAKSGTILKSLVEMPEGMNLSTTRAVRRVPEMRLVKRYPYHEGWMLQHWDPASMYGDRAWWEAQTVPNHPDLMTLGPFPERGRYEQTVAWMTVADGKLQIHGTMLAELPSLTKMEEAIQDHERKVVERFQSADAGWNRLIAINERMAVEEAEQKKRAAMYTLEYREKTKHLMGTSLAAGRMRAEAAKRCGITSHVGN